MKPPTAPSGTLRAIVLYKLVKSSLQLSLALLLLVLLPYGLPAELGALADTLHRHVTHAWALGVAGLLQRGSTRHGVLLASLALGLDGALTGVEGLALRSGRRWGAWLVVIATGALLPFEVLELLRAARPSRALLLALNLGIVLYLARRARSDRAGESAKA